VYNNSADPAAVLDVNGYVISQCVLNGVPVHVGGISVLRFHDIDHIAGNKADYEKYNEADKNNRGND
jgi:hypothetical protein